MRSALFTFLFLAAFLLPNLIFAQPPGWSYAQEMLLTEPSGNTQTDVQTLLILDSQSLISAGKMNPDLSDLRFANACQDTSFIPYFIAAYPNTDTTMIFLQIDSIAGNGTLDLVMFYGNPNAAPYSDPGLLSGPHSSTDSVQPTGTNTNSNSTVGTRFITTQEMIVTHFGKREPNGTDRYVTLWDAATTSMIFQDTVVGPAATWTYKALNSAIFLQQGKEYIITIHLGTGDQYYFQNGLSQAGTHMVYQSTNYCTSCNETAFPGSTLPGWNYGIGDFWYYIRTKPDQELTVQFAPTMEAEAGADTSICLSSSLQLNGLATGGNGVYTYLWSPGNSLSNPSIANPVASPATGTDYVLWVTDGLGCKATDTVNVAVQMIAQMLNLPADTAGCHVSNLTLDAGAGFSAYAWSSGGSGQTETVSADGIYAVTVTDNQGCTQTDSIEVNFSDPSVDLGPDTNLCDAPVILDAGSGFVVYAWTGGASTQTLSVSTNGSFWVQVEDQFGCLAADTVNVDTCVIDFLASDFLGSELSIFPNPTAGKVQVQLNLQQEIRAKVMLKDGLGRQVKFMEERNYPRGESLIELDLQNLPQGVYYLKWETAAGSVTRRIILARP
ncbi:MAG: DUF2341 domain-containing protein [Bacteroidia bacterium]|nr:DUF2341 domain-containing protein [Bacteroidia bacterium]